jgi:hypothetical protein
MEGPTTEDSFGTEVRIGDTIAYMKRGSLCKGEVLGITKAGNPKVKDPIYTSSDYFIYPKKNFVKLN